LLLAVSLISGVAIGATPNYAELRTQLPSPIYDAEPSWVAAYWKAWELASKNFYEPATGSGFVSPFIDAAFSDHIYFWDTAFMTMFTNVAHPLTPGIASLDNFYAKQHATGEISREIHRQTGADFRLWVNDKRAPLWSRWGWMGFARGMKPIAPNETVQYIGRNPPAVIPDLTLDALNHPIAAWAELESYRYTGDRARLERVREPLLKYYRFLDEHLRQGNGLYITDWASMDDSPRNPYLRGGGTAVDTSAEMVLFAQNLRTMGASVSNDAAERIRSLMWDPSRSFFVDLTLDGKRAPVKTVAGFWTLLAKVASKEQAAKLAEHLRNPRTFGTPHRVPTVAADEETYRPGVYWQGGVWAPTNTMVIRGLEAYDYRDLARQIALDHLRWVAKVLAATGTIWENYSPTELKPGQPARKDFVGWSGIAPILYLLEYGVGLRPDAARNRLEWSLPGSRAGCERYRFNGHVVDLLADGRAVTVNSDGAFDLRVTGGGKTRVFKVRAGKQVFRL
jgi:hypothetical protein